MLKTASTLARGLILRPQAVRLCSSSSSKPADDEPVVLEKNPYTKEPRKCILCSLGVEVDYKNPRLLQQFVSTFSGRVYDRHITGLCDGQQKKTVGGDRKVAKSRLHADLRQGSESENDGSRRVRNSDPHLLERSRRERAKRRGTRGGLSCVSHSRHLLIVDQNTFQIALPTLCILSARELSEQRKREFEEICAGVLLDPESTRPSRHAVLACLEEFRAGATWTEFYTLIEALEEPQVPSLSLSPSYH